jgi:hypothetical protein
LGAAFFVGEALTGGAEPTIFWLRRSKYGEGIKV